MGVRSESSPSPGTASVRRAQETFTRANNGRGEHDCDKASWKTIAEACRLDPLGFAALLADYIHLYRSDYPNTKTVVLCGDEKIVVRPAPATLVVLYPRSGTVYVKIEDEEVQLELDKEKLARYLRERLMP